MTGTREQNVDAYMLREKLKSRVKERGSDISGIRATSTSELKRRAEMGYNPRENCAQAAFDESYKRKASQAASGGGASRAQYNRASGYEAQRAKRSDIGDEARRGSSGSSASRNTRTAQSARASETRARQERAERVGREDRSGRSARVKREEGVKITPKLELAGRPRVFPLKLVATVVICTVLVFAMVLEYSEVYSATGRNDGLVSAINDKKDEEKDLLLEIENRVDMKEVEAYATSTLGMIKEDSLQRKYISISDGERIEVLREEGEDGEDGVMLSSFFATVTKFLERFK